MVLKFYTDGACSGNPGPGGYASIVIRRSAEKGQKPIKILSAGKQLTTNNEMELMAVLESLRFVVQNGIHLKKHRAEIYTDSAYVVNSINQKWYVNWSYNRWHTKRGTAVKNKEIWKEVCKLLKLVNARLIKVKGHNGNYFNEMADKAAKQEKVKYML